MPSHQEPLNLHFMVVREYFLTQFQQATTSYIVLLLIPEEEHNNIDPICYIPPLADGDIVDCDQTFVFRLELCKHGLKCYGAATEGEIDCSTMACTALIGQGRLMDSNSTVILFGVLIPKVKAACVCRRLLAYGLKAGLFIGLLMSLWSAHAEAADRSGVIEDVRLFVLRNGTDLREFGGSNIGKMLVRIEGQGIPFGEKQHQHYCRIKHDENVQWALNNLETGELIARSTNADEVFFGASVAKVFVAAALLHKQKGEFSKAQLGLMVRMIVVSSNGAWKELQRQVGDDGTDDAGRAEVDAFVQSMGYSNTRGFQGWWRKKDGTRIHGNELNSLELAKFVYDTYSDRYEGAEVLWHIMQATATGRGRINRYAPRDVFIGGKTGTYDGPNVSPETVKLKSIRARNHVVNLKIGNKLYGLAILTNTGSNEDVAVLGGGLMREYLGVEPEISCQAPEAIAP